MSSSTTNLSVLYTKNLNAVCKYECSICYKPIEKKMFKCSNPCNKLFHFTCLRRHFDQIEENHSIYSEEETPPTYRCCYCRRSTSIQLYSLEIMAHDLKCLQNSGCYFAQDTIDDIYYKIKHPEFIKDMESYESFIYQLVNDKYIKKPKKSKRADFKPLKMVKIRYNKRVMCK
jgi:hypothetical protein